MATVDTHRPQRPRTSSMLSFGSRKSSGSGGPKSPKIDLNESPREKQARRITGKADPSVAINELQPSVRAQEKSTMAPLRSMQHRDSFGNVITDPDRSNPTRPRMERPLDTIRSFESAIDTGYTKRYSAQPAPMKLGHRRHRSLQPQSKKLTIYGTDMQSRRSSYHQGFGGPPRTPGGNNGYFDRQPNSRPDSMYGEPQHDRGYPQNDRGYSQNDRGFPNGGGQYGHAQQRRYPPRNQSDPMMYGYSGYGNTAPGPVAPNPGTPGQWTHPALQQSQDNTTASTSGSYATDHGTNSTEASLHNSSYGELPQQYKPQPPPHDPYANGFGHGQPADSGYGAPNGHFPPQNGDMAPPPPPVHGRNVNGKTLRKQVRPQDNQLPPVPQHGSTAAPERPPVEKRKSWLARRFSKHG